MVTSALQAGVPEQQLRNLGSVLQKSNKMTDQPGRVTFAKTPLDVLGESEEEVVEEAGECEDAEMPQLPWRQRSCSSPR